MENVYGIINTYSAPDADDVSIRGGFDYPVWMSSLSQSTLTPH